MKSKLIAGNFTKTNYRETGNRNKWWKTHRVWGYQQERGHTKDIKK